MNGHTIGNANLLYFEQVCLHQSEKFPSSKVLEKGSLPRRLICQKSFCDEAFLEFGPATVLYSVDWTEECDSVLFLLMYPKPNQYGTSINPSY